MKIKANNPALKSWIEVSKDSDFPIQNLPFGVFKTDYLDPGVGVAIGNFILDLTYLNKNGFFDELDIPKGIFNSKYLNGFISLGKEKTRAVREKISRLLQHDCPDLRDSKIASEMALVPMDEAEMLMPVRVPNYTDFYSSKEHATNVGMMFRDPENALLPNWLHLPVAYHGRPSSIVVSGTPIQRPNGQTKAPDQNQPVFGQSKRIDFELEMAFITCQNTELGQSVSVDEAENFIFGFVLFNDWSARDLQVWEYVPLGPFLAKNFASSVSPWVVTLDALEPFRVKGPEKEKEVLPYLKTSGNKNFDINLQVSIQPENCKEEVIVSRSNFKYMYWNINEQLAHHTVNGCNIEVGDMYASGTISGPTPDSYGSMLELAWKGTKPIKMPDGTERVFINDGDTVKMKGFAQSGNIRIGFGEVTGK
ncbi:MAG: fumarylacetoacetase, partial [Cyclobacteriaceae bacterium]|nr:fumarylacetoacetase [Cyclobacteriaceae bacterium]